MGVSNEVLENLNNAIVKNSLDVLESVGAKNQALQETLKEAKNSLSLAESQLVEAQESGSAARIKDAEENVKYWTEIVENVNENAMASSEELLDTWANTIDAIQQKFDASIQKAVNNFNEMIYGQGDLSIDFERQQELSDLYLKDYEKIYELSKLTRDINNSIDDTKNIAGKQKLKKLLQDINDIQADGGEMSKYDLEYKQAEYELRLAQIALEEAQNAKNTVRLQRDNEGNLSYVYTSSTDAIDEAEQKYEDALYKMQDLSASYINEVSEQAIEAQQRMQEDLIELSKKGLTQEEFEKEKAKIINHYMEIIDISESEANKAIKNNQTLYDTDLKQWTYAIGEKQGLTEGFVQSYSDSVLGMLLGSQSTVADFGQLFGEAAKQMGESFGNYYAEYLTNINKASETAGVEEAFADMLTGAIQKIGEKSTESAQAVTAMKDSMILDFSNLVDELEPFTIDYLNLISPMIEINNGVIESINGIIKAVAQLNGTELDLTTLTNKVDIGNYLPSDNDPRYSAASGGYTGDWGDNSGRLLWVHPEEVILNPNDTANVLNTIKLTREMLQTIDLNAMQASSGTNILTPAVIREEKQQILEQQVSIVAEFPNVQNRNEIEEAFGNLINVASQYANRKN